MKPVVKYVKSPYDKLILGQSAFVYALNHPRLGRRFVHTSTVEKITENGFITRNTTYIGVDKSD